VSGRLAKEIKQTKPFALLEEEALLNLGRTYEHLQQRVAEVLKEHQLTPTQYNMLRILRGAGKDGLTCSQACERMITPDPDVTRLLDRMEGRNLIERERSKQDRRVVITKITPDGLDLTNRIDQPLATMLKTHLGHIGPDRLKDLIGTLELLREERN
jgi:DNA-binding MarR family transcriptional regulator